MAGRDLGLDFDFMDKQVADITEIVGNKKYWRPEEGKYRLRLLPGWKGGKTYFVHIAMHYNVGPQKKAFVCPRLTSSLAKQDDIECVICNLIAKLDTSEDKDDQVLADRMKVNHKYYMNVYLRPTDHEEGRRVIWPAPGQTHQAIHSVVKDKTGDLGDILDPFDGNDIVLERKGSNINTRYTIHVINKATPLFKNEAKIKKMLASCPNLMELVQAPDQKAIARLLEGEEGDEFRTDDDEDDEKPKKRRGKPVEEDSDDDDEEEEPKPKKKGKKVVEEEEEESDDDDEDSDSDDDEDEPEEKPAKKGKGKAKPKPSDDDKEEESDDEDEGDDEEDDTDDATSDDDDDEEDEKPKKPVKGKPKPKPVAEEEEEESDDDDEEEGESDDDDEEEGETEDDAEEEAPAKKGKKGEPTAKPAKLKGEAKEALKKLKARTKRA